MKDVTELISKDFQNRLQKKILSNNEIKNSNYSLALSNSIQLHSKEILSCDEKFNDYKSFHTTAIIIGISGLIVSTIQFYTGTCLLLIAGILFTLYLFIKKSEIKRENLLVKTIQDEIISFLSIKSNVL